jgi:hypothetical protein
MKNGVIDYTKIDEKTGTFLFRKPRRDELIKQNSGLAYPEGGFDGTVNTTNKHNSNTITVRNCMDATKKLLTNIFTEHDDNPTEDELRQIKCFLVHIQLCTWSENYGDIWMPISGPAGGGKSSLSHALKKMFGHHYVETAGSAPSLPKALAFTLVVVKVPTISKSRIWASVATSAVQEMSSNSALLNPDSVRGIDSKLLSNIE